MLCTENTCTIALDNLVCISLLLCSQNLSTRKVLPETANLIRQLKYVFAVSSSSHAFSWSELEAANYVEHLGKVHYLFTCLVLLSPNWRNCQRQSRLVKMPWTSSVCKWEYYTSRCPVSVWDHMRKIILSNVHINFLLCSTIRVIWHYEYAPKCHGIITMNCVWFMQQMFEYIYARQVHMQANVPFSGDIYIW